MRNPILLLALLSTFVSCRYIRGERVEGNGQIVSDNRAISGFEGVETYGSFDVEVSTGPHAVVIEADQNLQEYIDVHVEDGLLQVSNKEGFDLDPSRTIKVLVTAPEYKAVRSSGSGNITSRNEIKGARSLNIAISGSGNVNMTVAADNLEAEISGSGSITLAGTANDFKSSSSGSGDVKAMNLKTGSADIDIAGSGSAEIFVTDKLDVEIAGSGDVRYKGGAKLSSSVSGSGSVTNVE